MKYWQILLTKQRERGKDGLTLPFLIGSQEYLPKAHTRQNITDLILDIVSSNSFETCIRHCMGTQTLILEIRKQKNYSFFPTDKNGAQLNLSVSYFSKEDLGESVEILITRLIEKFQDIIDKRHFSAVPNVEDRKPNWTPFSQDDITFILGSFKSLSGLN